MFGSLALSKIVNSFLSCQFMLQYRENLSGDFFVENIFWTKLLLKRILDGGESEYFFSEYETSIPIPGEGERGKKETRVLRGGDLEEKTGEKAQIWQTSPQAKRHKSSLL